MFIMARTNDTSLGGVVVADQGEMVDEWVDLN